MGGRWRRLSTYFFSGELRAFAICEVSDGVSAALDLRVDCNGEVYSFLEDKLIIKTSGRRFSSLYIAR